MFVLKMADSHVCRPDMHFSDETNVTLAGSFVQKFTSPNAYTIENSQCSKKYYFGEVHSDK